jgi:hypothetical protein
MSAIGAPPTFFWRSSLSRSWVPGYGWSMPWWRNAISTIAWLKGAAIVRDTPAK